ncbi:MAG: glycine cleavage system aminomethyltransferase GcvT [Myxococcales bacterium]|nr:glycine cleavage system aminomethyltransferase GcvT [Myxococcales bacterium]
MTSLRTPLYDRHVALGARMVDFAGYLMPLNYGKGQLAEHHAVRSGAGLFDVSHMGQVRFQGPDAVAVVNRLITNDLAALPDGKALYTACCRDDGGILDDLICYRRSATDVLIVVNASNVAKIVAWFEARATGESRPVDVSDHYALLALQGPRAAELLSSVHPAATSMRPFHLSSFEDPRFGSVLVASTGYTGEAGFELFVAPDRAVALFDHLLEGGAEPIGLGARDTLRLEMKYALYGNDIDETTNPLEAGLGWVTKLDKPGGFIGQDALRAIAAAGVTRKLVGLEVEGRGIARHGYPVHAPGGDSIGVVTSGTIGPTVGKAIAMAYVSTPYSALGTRVEIDIRGKRTEAVVCKTPFLMRQRL